ncbi:hypothetical protein ASF28_08805 [Methylobacterium sp. Leaf99]|uniref:hypothetical protein n=1 Tax=Methylobacterium sp. Leaf99 TaxID=1736251 RepID=UPI0006FDF434|nr:hypothetical protein [Methylobacterium sp. Leaf99]KQP11133.1 hypothetical protein ASF28_08805 [Methylobacterium sp. Leaf99]
MAPTLPIAAVSLRFAYGEGEDRLTLLAADAQGKAVHVALTRRLTERLVNGLAHLLEQSSSIAVQAPAEMRDDIIMMEHQTALFGQGEPPTDREAEPSDEISSLPAPQLVTAMDINLTPTTFELQMRFGETPLIHLSLNRLQVHQLVEVLSQRAEGAGWNIAVGAAWMEPGQTKIVLN